MEQPDGNKGTIWSRLTQQITGITAVVVALGGLVTALERCGEPGSPPSAVSDRGSAAAPAVGGADAGNGAAGDEAADAGSEEAAPAELIIDASADPEDGAAPLAVAFSASVEGGAGALAYQWDFGDGSARSTKASPTHRYTEAGEYTVVVRVKDQNETEGETQLVVTVTDE